MRILVSTLLFLLVATSAFASDGVLEINQTCAVQTGCFSGDNPGFPVTIDGTAGNSYRLTSDLQNSGPNTDGIFLGTARLVVDFNGFSLVGATIGTGTGRGISGGGVEGAFAGFATIRNGTIRGARGRAIDLANARGVRVERMTLQFNAGGGLSLGEDAQVVSSRLVSNGSGSETGIEVGPKASILDTTVADSGSFGILAAEHAVLRGNSVSDAGTTGINCQNGCTITGNNVVASGATGIFCNRSCTLEGNTARTNLSNGLSAGIGSVVRGNTASANQAIGVIATSALIEGNTVSSNSGDGIQGLGNSLVVDNAVLGNGGYGIRGNDDFSYRGNVIDDNPTGTVFTSIGFALDTGGNVCNGSLTCP